MLELILGQELSVPEASI